LKKDFGNPRRTIIYPEEVVEQTAEQFVTHQDVMVTLSQRGYIKRVPCDTYKTQHRGGKGVRGMTTREDDALMDLVTVDTHDTLLFFTNRGRVYPLRVFQIPADTSRTTRGTLLINLIPLGRGEQVQTILRTQNPREGDLLILATNLGEVKALKEGQLSNIQARGLIVMDLEDGDELVGVSPLGDAEDVVMVSELGQAIRFPVIDLAPRSRTAGGVRGMRLKDGDRVVSMNVVTGNDRLLVVSKGGYGKSSRLSLYPTQSRNGQGVRTFKVTEKTGPVAIARVVPDNSDCEVFIISSKAQVVRINLDDVRVSGRATQGVIIWRDREPDDFVASVTLFEESSYTPNEPSSNEDQLPAEGN
jgi:DNA gyrase subunit A